TTIRLTIHGNQESMPEFVGRPLDAAQHIADSYGLVLTVEDKIFNPKYAANQIVSQDPAPGAPVKMGQHVHVLVSLGSPRVAVPSLVGDSVRAAQIKAIRRGLTVGEIASVHLAGQNSDQVLAQDPPAATAEMRSPAVNLLVSVGEAAPEFV